jgi:hypothetical protein
MFDVDRNGTLTRDEFANMIMATVNLNLSFLLKTQAGEAAFDSQVHEEFSHENLEFWQDAEKFRKQFPFEDSAAALQLAQKVSDMYVVDNAERQVNLPAKVQRQIQQDLTGAVTGGNAVKDTLFEEAAREIFTLMERDTYRRFRQDDGAVRTTY